VEADEELRRSGSAQIDEAVSESIIDTDDDPEWLMFLRPPEFPPPILDDQRPMAPLRRGFSYLAKKVLAGNRFK
jgi:hypothetical protein